MTLKAHDGIGHRLREERVRLGLTQKQIAERVGVSREMWARYEGGVAPGAGALSSAAAAGVDVGYVITGSRTSPLVTVVPGAGHELREPAAKFSPGAAPSPATSSGLMLKHNAQGREHHFVVVPRYGMRAASSLPRGEHRFLTSEVGEIAFEAEWMRRHLGRAGPGFALLDVAGSNMEPTLQEGATVVVDLHDRELASGGVYAVRDGEELLLRRLQRLLGGGVEIVSDNPSFKSQAVHLGSLEIVGRVVWPKVR